MSASTNFTPSSRPELLMIGPYPEWDMKPLESTFTLHKLWESSDAAVSLRQWRGVRAIATRGELGAKKELIDQLPNLEIIACYGVGTDAIDLEAARERSIRVTNTPEVLTKDVADMALGLTLALLRRIPQGDQHVRSGEWRNRNMELTTSLTGKAVGILGLGRIGQEVAKRAVAFEAQVAYTDRTKAQHNYLFCESVTSLAEQSDILIVTVAGGSGTRHIVNRDVFDALGPHGYLINVSRGSTVDEDALLDALRNRTIAGAALDVFASEPQINPIFSRLDNVLLQPHHSSGTVETRKAMGQLVRDNLDAHFRGLPLLTPVV